MAHLYQPTYPAPIPKTAEIVKKDGREFARFRSRGRVITAPLTDDGSRCLRKNRKWYGKYRDADGVIQREPLSTDKDEAAELLREIVGKVKRQKKGYLDPYEDHRGVMLSEHVEDFRRHLEAGDNSPDYVQLQAGRVQRVFDGCRFIKLQELQAHRVFDWLKRQRETGKLSAQTSNYYLQAVKQFGTWLIKAQRWPENLFDHLSPVNADVDVKRERRAATPEELEWLIKAAKESAEVYRHLAGEDRMMLYFTAAYSGLRAQELASLTPRSFDLAANPPTVTVAAGYSKRRRLDVQPLSPEAAAWLSDWIAKRREDDPDALLWPGSWWRTAARMLRIDLEAAREKWIDDAKSFVREQRERSDVLTYVDADGCVFDFHALRHTFISSLATAQVHPNTAKELARHSTIRLTMDRYTHLQTRDVAGALVGVPVVPKPGGPNARESLQATGTDGRADQKHVPKHVPPPGIVCPQMSESGESGGQTLPKEESAKPLKIKGLGDDLGECPDMSEEAPAGFEPAMADLQSAALGHLATAPG